MNIANVRGWQFTQLENNLKSVEWLLRTTDAQARITFRDGGSGWTALETLCHLRDFEKVFLQRARLTVEQDNPALPFPKPDDVAAEGRYNEQDFEAALAEWKSNRATLIGYLKERSDADWERPAAHPTRGSLTLFDQLFLTAMHDTVHMEQMTRTLHEKKLPS
jgi:uncharacterized damage-inducible protein DinB